MKKPSLVACSACLLVCFYLAKTISAAWHVYLVMPGPYEPLTSVGAYFTSQGVSVRLAAFGYFEDQKEDNHDDSAGELFKPEMEHLIMNVEFMGTFVSTQWYDPTVPDPDTPWRLSPGLPSFERPDHAVAVLADGSFTGYANREAESQRVQIIVGP